MNTIQFNSLVSGLLTTLTYNDAQNIRNAVTALIHDDKLTGPSIAMLGVGVEGSLYTLKVPPDYTVIIRQPIPSAGHLEVVDLIKEESVRKLQEAIAAYK